LRQPNQVFAARYTRNIDLRCQLIGGKFRSGMRINPQAKRTQCLRCQSFRQTFCLVGVRRVAVQQLVDIRLLIKLMIIHETFFLSPAGQCFFKARKLKRFNQVIHNTIIQRGFDGCRIRC